jgi:maltose alpha-D-glucosyltransferase / alpha-amylase
VLTVHNFAERPHELALPAEEIGEDRLSSLLEEDELVADDDGNIHIRLDALAYRWFRLGGLDYAVRRARD